MNLKVILLKVLVQGSVPHLVTTKMSLALKCLNLQDTEDHLNNLHQYEFLVS